MRFAFKVSNFSPLKKIIFAFSFFPHLSEKSASFDNYLLSVQEILKDSQQQVHILLCTHYPECTKRKLLYLLL